jgi:hypothetical protein
VNKPRACKLLAVLGMKVQRDRERSGLQRSRRQRRLKLLRPKPPLRQPKGIF